MSNNKSTMPHVRVRASIIFASCADCCILLLLYIKITMNRGHTLHAVLTAAFIRVITRKQTCSLYMTRIIMSCSIDCEMLMLCVTHNIKIVLPTLRKKYGDLRNFTA